MNLRIEESDGGVTFAVRVIPRASRDEVCGVHDGALKVKLTAPPVEGAANAALVRLLAKKLGVSRGAVRILQGEAGRQKRLRVEGADSAMVRARLE